MSLFPPGSFFVIAGPCVVESLELLDEVASVMQPLCESFGIPYIFKASYKKANRTSAHSFTGIGDMQALEYLRIIGERYNVPVLTDVHTQEEAQLAASYVDVLQIPAFLSRQTELLRAAARTGKYVNIKKGQFFAPDDMIKAVDKVRSAGNDRVWVTERGTCFGYHDLVVDYRSLVMMRAAQCPVIFDATHSVQQPSVGEESGGKPEFIPALARAAVAVGIDGLFFETHPDPARAKSDAATQLPLSHAERFLSEIIAIHKAASGARNDK